MKLPADTSIAEDKLVGYLLLAQVRGDKSVFLAQAGYVMENASQLLHDLRAQILPVDAVQLESNKFGQYYEICGALTGPKWGEAGCSHDLDDRTLVGNHKVRYTHSRQTEDGMKFKLYTDVVLTCDLPEHRLRRGDIVKLIDHHVAPDGTEGYSIEVFNAVGDTITVTAAPAVALEALREDEVLCARTL